MKLSKSQIENLKIKEPEAKKPSNDGLYELKEAISKIDVRPIINVDNKDIASAIKKNNEISEAIVSKIKELVKPSNPQVNVNTDTKPIIEAIESMKIELNKTLENLSVKLNVAKPDEWEFTINRSIAGNVESVSAKPKYSV